MNFYSYKIDHDYGLAPNPFGPYCTLAVCKSKIRSNKNLAINDWVIGTGSKALRLENYFIYAMQVQEIISFEEYWDDERFQYKKPILNGSLITLHGDNIYHRDEGTGEWVQENSAHSVSDELPNVKHLKRDVGGRNVLISQNFYYLGNKATPIPDNLKAICNKTQGMKYKSITENLGTAFVNWVQSNFKKGVSGYPISWKDYKQKTALSIFMSRKGQ